ncbi:MAG: hypothetical protein ACM32E_29610 [Gemmatimonadota bacterium]
MIGGVVLLVTLADVFVTVFNYDGFTFLSGRFHRLFWHGLRRGTSWLPAGSRAGVLSLGSAAMLPATLIFWLVLEVSAFALMYLPGLTGGGFRLSDHLQPQIGTASTHRGPLNPAVPGREHWASGCCPLVRH